ncbi:MAG: hypothetical protein GF334_09450 [Candidatus Altiarchaeales archaeon]|nr:hypothetical protein [Candidatus Altiarchaeales archaeon]
MSTVTRPRPKPQFPVELMGVHKTFVLDAASGERVYAEIRPITETDLSQVQQISQGYSKPAQNTASYVLATKDKGRDKVEGILCVSPGKHNNTNSLSVDGVDCAPENMRDSDNRNLRYVGSRLLEYAVKISRREGLKGRLHMLARDTQARQFYENLGFDGEGIIKSGKHFFLPEKNADKLVKHLQNKIKPPNIYST